jgi:hypothetical protein
MTSFKKSRPDKIKPKAYRQLTSLKLHPFTIRLLEGVQVLTHEKNRTRCIERAIWLAYWKHHMLEPKTDELLQKAGVRREKTSIVAELDRKIARVSKQGVSFSEFLEKLGLDSGMAKATGQLRKNLRRSGNSKSERTRRPTTE